MRALALALLLAAPAARAQGLDARLADLRLATAVRLALAGDPATARLTTAVHARGGAVALDAKWPSTDVQARAEAVARGVRGVAAVVFGDAPPPPAQMLGVDAGEPLDGETEYEATEVPGPEPAPRTAAPPARHVDPEPQAVAPVRRLEPEPVADPEPVRGGWNTPPPEPEAPVAAAAYHTVLLGDTLFSIARRYETTVEALQALNGLGASTGLALGQRLRVR